MNAKTAEAAKPIDPLKILDENGEFPGIWSPEPGDVLKGVIRRYTEAELEKSGHTWICTIQDGPESVWSVFLSPTVLKSEFARKKPKVGERISIKFLGTPAGKAYKKFSVAMLDRSDAGLVPDWNELDPDQANYNESTQDERSGPYATATIEGPQGGRRTVDVPLPSRQANGGAAVAERPATAGQQPGDDEIDPFVDA